MTHFRSRDKRASPLMRQHLLVVLSSVFTLGGCVSTGIEAPQPQAPAAEARFESFTYVGDDEAFRGVEVGPDEYLNPVLLGFHPDPSVTRVGEDYYLVNSSFATFPGIPIWHSRDLVTWAQIGHVLDRPSQLPLEGTGISRGIFAPTIRHHEGTFYVLTTWTEGYGNGIVTATNPAGPWSDPVWLPFGGVDPDLFVDDDGRAYVANSDLPAVEPTYLGHRAVWIQEIDLETLTMIGERRLIVDGGTDLAEEPAWVEGPHIFKRDGWYYLLASEGGTEINHSVVIFRSRDVMGPYEPWEGGTILTQRDLDPARPLQVTSTGHADFVQTPAGDWWAVFLGARPYRGDEYNTGRETFVLPVDWPEGGWPMILPPGEVVPYVAKRPDLPAGPAPDIPMSGNFSLSDDFDGDELARYWTFVRTPRVPWHRLEDGALVLEARPVALADAGQPSFVGRRQQHLRMTAETVLDFSPVDTGDRAGLAAFQGDEAYLLLSIARRDGRRVVEVESRFQGEGTVLASAVVPDDGPVRLRIQADGADYRFAYALADGDWQTLAEGVDGSILSTLRATGFVGTLIGMYATSAHP